VAITTYVAVPTLAVGDKLTAARWNTVASAIAFQLNPPEAMCTNTAGTSIPNNSETVVPMAGETVDTGPSWDGAMHSTSTNTSRITITTAGRYDIDGLIAFAANATGRRVCNMRLNANGTGGAGTLLRAFSWPSTLTSADFCYLPVRTSEDLAVGNVIELFAFQTSGAGLALSSAAGGNYLRARLIGS